MSIKLIKKEPPYASFSQMDGGELFYIKETNRTMLKVSETEAFDLSTCTLFNMVKEQDLIFPVLQATLTILP